MGISVKANRDEWVK